MWSTQDTIQTPVTLSNATSSSGSAAVQVGVPSAESVHPDEIQVESKSVFHHFVHHYG